MPGPRRISPPLSLKRLNNQSRFNSPNITFIRERTRANTKAEKNPEVLNPVIILSTNNTINTVIMNDISPSVRKLIGNVRIRNIVPMVAFAKAINIPAIVALKKPLTCTPGIKYAAIKTASPINRISTINFIFYKIRISILLFICFIILITSCQTSTENTNNFKSIKFELSADSSKIILKGLEHNIILSLKKDTLSSEEWQNLFSVYVKPLGADESSSLPVNGNYSISDNNIFFSPDTSFIKGHTYDAVFIYPQYYSVSSALSRKSLPGKMTTIENHFDF